MIKVTFHNKELIRIFDRRHSLKVRQVCVKEIKRTHKVWFFEVEKGIFYFNYNNSQIIKSIEKIEGWI